MPDHSDSDDNQNAIAIIGMSVRLPGASNLADYWDMLLNGKDAIHFFTENELKAAGVPPGQINDPNFIASRGYLAGIDEFDASFFGISPREAALMDPQHRVLMEVAWHAFEHSGYDPDQWDGDCSIFTSAGMNTYLPFNIFTNPGLVNEVGGFQLSIYNDKDFVPTRIAYALNTKGPAIDIGTACSSSLVGTHLACQHLLSYQSDLALVGGVTVHLPQETGDLVEAGSAYSPDGHCRPFDASPSGLVDGNGAVAIILKRLDDAVQDRDTIHAVIKGSAINNDGSEKVGYSAPSIQGQTQVIFEAQALAQITADQISYVEAHGTATPLGDPIEVAGLTQAFRETTDDTQFCGLGSVKSNIGHVDKAAGLAGLVKTVLGLKHEVMPPTANFKSPNPRLKIEETPFFVVAQPQPWERSDNIPRIAAISSFGVGGTNAHAIISESPLSTKQPTSDRPELIVLSAKSEPAVERLIAELQQSVDQQTGNLDDIGYTLKIGRKRHQVRTSFVSKTKGSLKAELDKVVWRQQSNESGRIAFLFSGQGTQYPDMGRELYEVEPIFRDSINRIEEIFIGKIDLKLTDLLYGTNSSAATLQQTRYAQPALFAVEFSLAKLLQGWGISPSIVLGHSLGEFVAACIAGVFSLADAVTLIAARGRLMQSMEPGRMLAITLGPDKVLKLISANYPSLDIASINGEQQTVVSGPNSDIAQLASNLQDQGVLAVELDTSHAFHSRMMDPVIASFSDLFEDIKLNPPSIPIISNLTGNVVQSDQICTSDYWCNQLRSTVQFYESLQTLKEIEGDSIWLEIGPGRALCNMANTIKRPVLANFPTLPPVKSAVSSEAYFLTSVGKIWEYGVDIDWQSASSSKTPSRVPLPGYPFEKSRFWTEPGTGASNSTTENSCFYQLNWAIKPIAQSEITQGKPIAVLGVTHSRNREKLVQHYERLGCPVTHVLDLDNLPDIILFFEDSATAETSLIDALSPLIEISRQIVKSQKIGEIRLIVAGSGILKPTQSALSPARASLPSVLRTLSHEQPTLDSFVVDFPGGIDGIFSDRTARSIVHETLRHQQDGDVILEAGTRMIKKFNRIPVESKEQNLVETVDQLVVIGGDSPIGMVVCDALVKAGTKSLHLTGSFDTTTAAKDNPDLIRSWRNSGVEVTISLLTAEDPFNFAGTTEESEVAPVRKIGVIDASDFHVKKPSDLLIDIDLNKLADYCNQRSTFLNRVLEFSTTLDVSFVILMTSLSAHLGGARQIASAALGLFSEAIAHQYSRREEIACFVSHWDQWSMTDKTALTPETGSQAIQDLFSLSNLENVLIANKHPRDQNGCSVSATDAVEVRAENSERYSRPALSSAFTAPENELQKEIAQAWQAFLLIDEIGIDDDFFAIGGNSLLGAQLISELNQTHQVDLGIPDLFDHSTVRRLTDLILSKQTSGLDNAQLSAELDRLESLSDDDIAELLDAQET